MVDMVQDAASEPNIYRELDASVRAALAGDDAPLLRLVAQTQSYLHGASPADYFSNGLYFAVSCMDYPQLFSMRSTPSQRREQLAARLLSPPAGAFTPFTAREWFTMSAYSEPYQACLDWPRPAHTAPVVEPGVHAPARLGPAARGGRAIWTRSRPSPTLRCSCPASGPTRG